jgi:hypothetical protein
MHRAGPITPVYVVLDAGLRRHDGQSEGLQFVSRRGFSPFSEKGVYTDHHFRGNPMEFCNLQDLFS